MEAAGSQGARQVETTKGVGAAFTMNIPNNLPVKNHNNGTTFSRVISSQIGSTVRAATTISPVRGSSSMAHQLHGSANAPFQFKGSTHSSMTQPKGPPTPTATATGPPKRRFSGTSHPKSLSVKAPSSGTAIRSSVPTNQLPREIIHQNQQRESIEACVKCGKAFKPSSNQLPQKFCSPQCAKGSYDPIAMRKPKPQKTNPPFSSPIKLRRDIFDQDGESSLSSRSSTAEDQKPIVVDTNNSSDYYLPPKKKKKKGDDESYEWDEVLNNPKFTAASVSQVKHAPLARIWENVTIGMKLEVENRDVDHRISEKAFWVASVIKIQGYYVNLRYEGFGNDTSGDFWAHLCSSTVHHVGWCANKGKPLIPPKSIAKKFTDWRNFLVNRLTGARTLPLNFLTKVANCLQSQYQVGDVLEVVDKNQISRLRVATITQVVGRRLHVEYFDSTDDGGFWCHEESRLIHPEGWAKTMGHQILAPPTYDPNFLASTPYDAEYEALHLQVGMKLEAIDPLNLSAICAATVKKVLRRGYVMVRIDCYEEDNSGFDWFCYHISSPCVYPCGFCAENGVTLTPPNGYDKATFNWQDYFEETKTVAAPVKPKKPMSHKLKVGMKIEAADLMDPRLICVATISQVVGRLLKIHFDGWEEEYDQWMDARSPDIYPIGWCELVNHKLEPPRPPVRPPKPQAPKKTKKAKKKFGIRGGKLANAKNTLKTENQRTETNLKAEKVSDETSSMVQKNELNDSMGDNSAAKPIKDTPAVESTAVDNKLSLPEEAISVQRKSFNGESDKTVAPKQRIPNAKVHPVASSSSTSSNISKDEEFYSTDPNLWSNDDVIKFLRKQDCGPYCQGFIDNKIDGENLMSLTKEDIIRLSGMKVGPGVKIFELISQLRKRCVSATKSLKPALTK